MVKQAEEAHSLHLPILPQFWPHLVKLSDYGERLLKRLPLYGELSTNEVMHAIVIVGVFRWKFKSLRFTQLMVHYDAIMGRWGHPRTGRSYRNRTII